MSLLKNAALAIVPIRERRETFGSLAALNAEVVLDVNGDESALVYVQSTAFIGTLTFEGVANSDATQYFSVLAYPYAPGCVGGTIPNSGQPLLTEALVAANTARVYAIPVGQIKKLRVKASAFTSGSCIVTILSEAQASLSRAMAARTSTLLVTAVGAASASVTATVPAVAGLRHIIDYIEVTRSATTALVAAATPVTVTSTNIPGALALTFGSDAAGIGIDKVVKADFGGTGMATTTINTATTVVCPVYTGVIWRVTIAYRLGI